VWKLNGWVEREIPRVYKKKKKEKKKKEIGLGPN
jgi:hypothetical protein